MLSISLKIQLCLSVESFVNTVSRVLFSKRMVIVFMIIAQSCFVGENSQNLICFLQTNYLFVMKRNISSRDRCFWEQNISSNK